MKIVDENKLPLNEASRLSGNQTGRNMLLSDAVVPGMRAKLCARQEQINGQLAHLAISRWNAQSLLHLRSRKVGTMPRCLDAARYSLIAAGLVGVSVMIHPHVLALRERAVWLRGTALR